MILKLLPSFFLSELMQVYEAARWTISELNRNNYVTGVKFGKFTSFCLLYVTLNELKAIVTPERRPEEQQETKGSG